MIICINGPGGSGKSTVSKLLAQKFEKGVCIEIDTVKHFVKSGFIYNKTPEGQEQWKLLTENCISLSKNFLNEGYTVVLDGFLGAYDRDSWELVFAAFPEIKKILLLPNRDTVAERNQGRTGTAKLEDKVIAKHLDFFDASKDLLFHDFTIVDSSEQSLEETVERLYILSSQT